MVRRETATIDITEKLAKYKEFKLNSKLTKKLSAQTPSNFFESDSEISVVWGVNQSSYL